jgi:thiamine kinase-like enzyme
MSTKQSTVITDVSQINLDWLDHALRRSGALISGRVRDFSVSVEGSTNACVAKLHVAYDEQATGKLPARLFLKLCSQSNEFVPDSEVNYFLRDYVGLVDAAIPTCYDASYDGDAGIYHILMDDLSTSHRSYWGMTPTLAHGVAMAQTLARLHAYRWGEERFAAVEGRIPSRSQIERYVAVAQEGVAPLLAAPNADLEPAWPDALRAVFEHHPQAMIKRTQNPVGFTLVHGDVNPGNILVPISGEGTIYLIDRQPFEWSLTTWLGVSDLAYMMVLWWETELRRSLEWPVLRAYHAGLQQQGVTDYAWEQLVDDYRLCALQGVYVATDWCSDEKNRTEKKWIWWPKLQRSMAAFFDLGCAELWESRP